MLARLKIAWWTFDSSQNRLDCSPTLYTMLGLKTRHNIGISDFLDCFPKGCQDQILEAVSLCLKNGTTFDLTLPSIPSKDRGSAIRILGSLLDDGRIERLIEDTSKSEELEKQFEEASYYQAEYMKLLDDTAIIARTDAKGLITHVNDKFCKISQYSREELLGQDHRILNSAFHPPGFFKSLWKSIASGKMWHGQIKNRAKDGSFYWVDTFIHPLKSQNKKIEGYISIRRDITEEKEQQVGEIHEAKLMAVGEVSAQILHDVMNPLSLIQGNAHGMKRLKFDEAIRERAESHLAMIDKGTDRIKGIFKEMRAMLIGDVNMNQVDLKVLVEDAISILKDKLHKYDVKIDSDLDECIVSGNRTLLIQVFTNLIKNSLEAVEQLDERWIRIEIAKVGKFAFVRVIDSGSGIPADIQDHMFDNFYSSKRDRGGTGLGLALSKKIVDLHEARIEVNQKSKHTEIDVIFSNCA